MAVRGATAVERVDAAAGASAVLGLGAKAAMCDADSAATANASARCIAAVLRVRSDYITLLRLGGCALRRTRP